MIRQHQKRTILMEAGLFPRDGRGTTPVTFIEPPGARRPDQHLVPHRVHQWTILPLLSAPEGGLQESLRDWRNPFLSSPRSTTRRSLAQSPVTEQATLTCTPSWISPRGLEQALHATTRRRPSPTLDGLSFLQVARSSLGHQCNQPWHCSTLRPNMLLSRLQAFQVVCLRTCSSSTTPRCAASGTLTLTCR